MLDTLHNSFAQHEVCLALIKYMDSEHPIVLSLRNDDPRAQFFQNISDRMTRIKILQ
uniref:RIH domain-containing protein n=1 Tax=Anguilla anguilla TaxID=7936 RepID=A0A0E9XB31_ANGAN